MTIRPGTRLRRYDPIGERYVDFTVTSIDPYGRGKGLTDRRRTVAFVLVHVRHSLRENGRPRFEVLSEPAEGAA